jgi:hypothetical protein
MAVKKNPGQKNFALHPPVRWEFERWCESRAITQSPLAQAALLAAMHWTPAEREQHLLYMEAVIRANPWDGKAGEAPDDFEFQWPPGAPGAQATPTRRAASGGDKGRTEG